MQQWNLIIIGAGLSGIDAACHFSMHCPEKRYTIFEARGKIGGTWDLFTYPGIRSDSDMHTFSYRFKPWTYPKTVSDGATIMAYLQETVEEYKVDEHIQFHRRIERINWSSEENRWTVTGTHIETGEVIQASCQFLMVCTGYYDYEAGYTPEFPGLSRYQGEFIHPQAWRSDIAYADKEIVVIGSGATAVTLIPALAEKARHLTMLQRSPSYIMSRPLYDPFAKWAHRLLPARMAHTLARWKNILLSMYLYRLSKKRPATIRDYIKGKITEVLGKDYDVDTHFSPSYQPWDERLCAVPDNDLFLAIKEEKCTVVTDQIKTFTEQG
ncbi:MAG: NAD(P)/FAD-dependent oxidoreductase, partial [Bacteroidota bacterium]